MGVRSSSVTSTPRGSCPLPPTEAQLTENTCERSSSPSSFNTWSETARPLCSVVAHGACHPDSLRHDQLSIVCPISSLAGRPEISVAARLAMITRSRSSRMTTPALNRSNAEFTRFGTARPGSSWTSTRTRKSAKLANEPIMTKASHQSSPMA